MESAEDVGGDNSSDSGSGSGIGHAKFCSEEGGGKPLVIGKLYA